MGSLKHVLAIIQYVDVSDTSLKTHISTARKQNLPPPRLHLSPPHPFLSLTPGTIPQAPGAFLSIACGLEGDSEQQMRKLSGLSFVNSG